MSNSINRRSFLKSSAIAAAAGPAIITAKRSAAQDVVGDGELKFHCEHRFPQLPSQYSWQTTHNVAVDPDNNLYVIHEGHADKTDHPSIFVFDSDGFMGSITMEGIKFKKIKKSASLDKK